MTRMPQDMTVVLVRSGYEFFKATNVTGVDSTKV